MAKEFAARFHLRHPTKGFNVMPWDAEDAGVYFGERKLNEQLQRRVEAAYALGRPPKIYIQGRWGAGKTHHLYHLKYILESKGLGGKKDFIVRFFQVECEDDTAFQYLHRKMLNSLGMEVVKKAVSDFLMEHGTNRADEQKRLFDSQNLIVATQVLSIGDEQLAWRWLSGGQLSSAELRSLNVTSNLEDTTELVDVQIRLGRLLQEQGRRIVFLIDEAESLKNVTKANAQRSWHDGLRNLADSSNNSIGYVMATFVDLNNPYPEFAAEEDIVRRLGQQNILTLEPYSDPNEVKAFIQDLLKARVDPSSIETLPAGVKAETYPFTEDALDLFMHEVLAGVSPTPSKIIEAVSECALAAHLQDQDTIELDVVRNVVPSVVSAP